MKTGQHSKPKYKGMVKHIITILMFSSVFLNSALYADEAPVLNKDPHINALGFFDIHICNWPERPNYFKVLFETEKYQHIDSMSVYTPDDKLLVTLDKTKFLTQKRKFRPEKRFFILDIDVPDFATTGWYTIDVKTKNGKSFRAKDYVIMSRLERVSKMTPANDIEVRLPVTLQWKTVLGAYYYQVFVRDAWTDELVYSSNTIETNAVIIPNNRLEAGGYYYWTVNARDLKGSILLGDFHMGSMSDKAFFNVAD